jgi:Na+-driven multidrug efflux pump
LTIGIIRPVTDDSPLTQRRILRFFWPLAASWVLMSLEFPAIALFVGRLPEAKVSFAAIGIVMTLAFWVEAPIISLLSTATALAVNRSHYLALRRFVLWLLVLVTVVGTVVAFTPLYDLIVKGLLGVRGDIAEAGRPAMAILIPWSACIGWRRYTQGILIRYGHTREVGLGTVVRIAGVLGCGWALFAGTDLPGASVAAAGVMGGVLVEAVFIHLVARPVLRERFSPLAELENEPTLTFSEFGRFHFPMTMSTMLWLLSRPLQTWALAKHPDQKTTLSAWEPATSMMFMFRAPSMALPEVVIALNKSKETAAALHQFCLTVGGVSTAALLVFVVSPLGPAALEGALSLPPDSASLARTAMLWCALIPFLGGIQSYYRGMLSAARKTSALVYSMIVFLGGIAVTMGIAVALNRIDVVTAACGLTLSLCAELVCLWLSWRSLERKGALTATAA